MTHPLPARAWAHERSPASSSGKSASAFRGRALSLVALAMIAACSSDAQPLPVENLREITSPPGAGSGEAHLALDGADVILSWLEPASAAAEGVGGEGGGGGDVYDLRMARLSGDDWSGTRRVASGDDFFVNWADFPSVVPVAPGLLAAHWLVRGPAGGYDYAIHMALSEDDGRSWSEAWTPHEDGTSTEHGFVSILPMEDESMGVIWLDGRDYAAAEAEGEGRRPEMALRFRQVSLRSTEPGVPPRLADGASEEVVLDSRVCECCQTSAARTSGGIVAVYRDRSTQEVRDIAAVRHDGEGWSEPVPVHEDGWVINACPVNGPAIAASGDRVATAWFTGAGDVPRVRLAFSSDGGGRFGPPVEIDGGNPAGRVGIVLLDDGSALVSWLERAGEGAEVRVRRVAPDGRAGRPRVVASSSASRASGFPQMVVTPDDRVVFAWTDPGEAGGASRVRVAHADVPGIR